MAAASEMLATPPEQFGLAVLADNVVYLIWLPLLLASKNFADRFNAWAKVPDDDPRRQGKPPPLDHVYDDVNSGSRYIHAHIKLCTGERDVLLPVIMFIDKSHTDLKGNKTLEAVCITLGIFPRHIRNKPEAWSVIGYIPNKLTYKGAKTAELRCSDFHYMLAHIIKPLKELLGNPGFRWVFDYKGRKWDSVAKGYLAFCCGNHEGQAKSPLICSTVQR